MVEHKYPAIEFMMDIVRNSINTGGLFFAIGIVLIIAGYVVFGFSVAVVVY